MPAQEKWLEKITKLIMEKGKNMSNNINDKQDLIETLPLLARQYLQYLTTIKNSSRLTVREYIFDLRLFFRFMKSRKLKISYQNIEEIDILDIDISFIEKITREDIFEFLFFISEKRDNINGTAAIFSDKSKDISSW